MTLSPEDFENLARDLFSEEWGCQLESFKPGKDAGIDLRHSRCSTANKTTIVQCKRYEPGSFKRLLRTVKKDELPKLNKLKPDRYVLVTSAGLSPLNKEELINTLKPWCRGVEDIYGPNDLNGMLNRFPEIEKAHFKLWISSTAVLDKILNANIFNITEDTLYALKAQICKLVIHEGLNRALELLHNHHNVLITGNPGIGKTTLAKMMMCHYIQQGFQPVVITSNISEAWSVITAALNAKEKTIILYDDFLGEIRFNEAKFEKNEDRSLIQLLKRVQSSSNLRFILTTREYILADAERLHEILHRNLNEFKQCTISLDDYTERHRARILFNHLYFSDVAESRLRKLVEEQVYKDVISHRHFNPRIVEGISKADNSASMSDEEYLEYIRAEFDDPSRVWEHPFLNQISPISRQVLVILWSFGWQVDCGIIERSVILFNSEDRPEEISQRFRNGLKELAGNFISVDRYRLISSGNDYVFVIKAQNPSIQDFVEKFLAHECIWIDQIIPSITHFSQVEIIFQWAFKGKKALRPSFWKILFEAGIRTQNSFRGKLINFEGQKRPVFYEKSDFSRSGRLLCILKILKLADLVDDAVANQTQAQLEDVDKWNEILDAVSDDSYESYSIYKLLQWMMKDSGYSNSLLQIYSSAFYQALMDLLSSEKMWSATLGSLRYLAECVSIIGFDFSENEEKNFSDAADLSVETAISNVDDPEELDEEADDLKLLSELVGFDALQGIKELLQKSQDLRDSRSEPEEEEELNQANYQDPVSDDFDIDSLFLGLFER